MMKSAIVGCGGIAVVHAQSLIQRQIGEIVGFADIKPERAQAYAQRFGGRAYSSLEEMLSAEKPDVLHICTPHYLHVPMAVYALGQGVHVFMEKPPVISTQQYRQLAEAVQQAEKRIGFCFQNRYNKSVQLIKGLLASGEAGKVLGARGFVTWCRNEKYYTESGWRGSLTTEGGSALANQSVHTLDLLNYFLGKPVWTDARMANHHLQGVIETEDAVEAYIRYENVNASFYATTAYCADVPPLIEIACENRTIRMEGERVTYFYPDARVELPEVEVTAPLGKSYWGSGHAGCIEDFYESIKTQKRYEQDLEGIEDTLKLMLAVYESARTDSRIYTDSIAAAL